MPGILDQLAAQRPRGSFRPTSIREMFMLCLAQRLSDPVATNHYLELANRHSDATLLLAYHRTIRHARVPDLATAFHRELATTKEQQDRASTERLLAAKIERRSIAIAVFVGTRLDFHDVHNLSSQPAKAEGSTIGFLNWVISSFGIDSASVESLPGPDEIRRAMLNRATVELLRANAIPLWEVSKQALLTAYGYPPLRTRKELREIAHAAMWSMFNTEKPNCHELDAAALGLYVQTERLFIH